MVLGAKGSAGGMPGIATNTNSCSISEGVKFADGRVGNLAVRGAPAAVGGEKGGGWGGGGE